MIKKCKEEGLRPKIVLDRQPLNPIQCVLFFVYLSFMLRIGNDNEIEAGELVVKLDGGGYRQVKIEEVKEIRLDRKYRDQRRGGYVHYQKE